VKTDSSKRRILIIDDDEHTRTLLRDFCEQSSFTASVAPDGEQIVEKLGQFRPDLVLLDLVLPKKDGFAVLKEIRDQNEWTELPVVILTAVGDMDGKIRGMELGADDFITKPFKLVDLQTRVSSALTIREYRKKLTAAEEALAQLRAVDPVTGAGTYAQLKASVDSEIVRSRRYGRPAAALVLGIDDYQGLRFQLGREKCDALIAGIADKIRGSLRGADQLFRMDLGEFVILLPETDLQAARIAAGRLGQVLQNVIGEGREGPVSVSARIGGSAFPGDGVNSTEDLLREANRVYRVLRETHPPKFIFDV
jgi:diguanylate cyclase (GGDEF)-like protein